jgi:hypothetical protein
MQKFLLSPNMLKETADLMRELETNGITDGAMSIINRMAKTQGFHWLAGGTVGAITAQSAPPDEPYVPTDPGLLEGFGVPNQ